MKPPRIRGNALRLVRVVAEANGRLLAEALKQSLGIDKLRALPPSARGDLPLDQKPVGSGVSRSLEGASLGPLPIREWPPSSRSIQDAYAKGRIDPEKVTERLLGTLEDLSRGKTLNVLTSSDASRTRREAKASAERWRRNASLGAMDGVPYLAKDEFDVVGLPTTLGTPCEPTDARTRDATVVRRMSDAGGIFGGKTVLTEWGMSPLGENPTAAMPHNAHHKNRMPGGSSTGSGVAVALGLVPIAFGSDGGGSIRIPASLNGIFGIKPTFGRVSRCGSGFQGSVAHMGPLTSNVTDLALALNLLSSRMDEGDPATSWAPPPPPGGFGARLGAGVRGLRIGVPDAEWADAADDVARAGRAALAGLEREGAVLVPVSMPLAGVAAPIGYVTISSESFGTNLDHWHHRRELMSDGLRVSYAVAAQLTGAEIIDAQRLRTALRKETAQVLTEVDVIALPTTATTAPALPEVDRGKSFSDAVAIDAMCRFNFLGNVTGLPAGTAPVGADGDGAPIGLQILGDAWDEHVVLGVLAHLERTEIASVRRPPFAIDLFG